MAFHAKCVGSTSEEMTAEEFKLWLQQFDADGDGRISKQELRAALRSRGLWFTTWKSRRGVGFVDSNRNGYIDADEVDLLVMYARDYFGIKVAAC